MENGFRKGTMRLKPSLSETERWLAAGFVCADAKAGHRPALRLPKPRRARSDAPYQQRKGLPDWQVR